MKLYRRILYYPLIQSSICLILAILIKATYFTCFKKIIGKSEYFDQLLKEGRQFILVCWHGRIFMISALSNRKISSRFIVLASRHHDGAWVRRTLAFLGLESIAGSSSSKTKDRGGSAALRSIIKAIKSGRNLVITPDGPRGPNGVVKPSVAYIAAITGVPIVPFSFSASPAIRLPSWDRFLIPLPFTKLKIVVGEPIMIQKEMDEDERVLAIKAAIDKAEAEALES